LFVDWLDSLFEINDLLEGKVDRDLKHWNRVNAKLQNELPKESIASLDFPEISMS
jgi:hypothetical protein